MSWVLVMTNMRSRGYDLNCGDSEYKGLIDFFTHASLSNQVNRYGWQTFAMPDNIQISIKDRRGENSFGAVSMGVKRTSLREPRYVRRIVKRFEGSSNGSMTSTIEGLLERYVGKNSEDFLGR